MNQDLQTFKEKISRELLSKTETYWLDQIEFEITNKDLNILVNSEFVKTSIEKKIYDKILSVSDSISGINSCIFVLDPSKKPKIINIESTSLPSPVEKKQ